VTSRHAYTAFRRNVGVWYTTEPAPRVVVTINGVCPCMACRHRPAPAANCRNSGNLSAMPDY